MMSDLPKLVVTREQAKTFSAVDSWAEVDVWRYQTTEAANEGHLRACLTWGQR